MFILHGATGNIWTETVRNEHDRDVNWTQVQNNPWSVSSIENSFCIRDCILGSVEDEIPDSKAYSYG